MLFWLAPLPLLSLSLSLSLCFFHSWFLIRSHSSVAFLCLYFFTASVSFLSSRLVRGLNPVFHTTVWDSCIIIRMWTYLMLRVGAARGDADGMRAQGLANSSERTLASPVSPWRLEVCENLLDVRNKKYELFLNMLKKSNNSNNSRSSSNSKNSKTSNDSNNLEKLRKKWDFFGKMQDCWKTDVSFRIFWSIRIIRMILKIQIIHKNWKEVWKIWRKFGQFFWKCTHGIFWVFGWN